ncbi:hypothetical protein K457DRAFT_133053 [Linnemannia elongata AG-77]|uniref:Galactose oxidase n=1 Tax=Linnemannia elongata AG-77 TaxID=1314771 RepID=A0A197KDH3_9FUNG|nr:hypothetical protein K457DRAFT_133053 [Linnemannia elongata AG-77]
MQLSLSLSTAVLLLLRLPLFLTTTTTTITHTQAQEVPPITAPPPPPSPSPTTGPYNPTSLYSVQSVFVEGRALYVHGGLNSVTGVPSGQTFALDLSVSWKTSQPAFKQLSTSFPSSAITSALMPDKNKWVMTNGTQAVFYSIEKDTWNNPITLTELNPKPGLPAVTDMSTGVVYFVNGFVMLGGSAPAVETIPVMMMLKLVNGLNTFSSMGTSTKFTVVDSGYASCWSTVRKSILLHGGLTGSPNLIYQRTLYEFNTTLSTFATINDNGAIPTARSGHCMVEAYNGTKIVLFGGVDQTSAGLSDIYFLDVATLTWTTGKTGGAGVGRAYAACAVTNDRFVAWGGASKINGDFVAVPATNATVVYDLIQNKWITTFSPLKTNSTSPDPDPSTPPTPSAGEETSSSKGALIGGIVGGVIALAAIAVFIFFCRRRSARRKESKEKNMSFATFAAMPVVTARTGSTSDDSHPDHQQQQQQQQRRNTRETEKDDDEEQDECGREEKLLDDDNDGITYVVGARAMPTSPTESSFRNSGIIPQNHNYQQLQQVPPTQQPLQQPLQPLQPLSPIQEQQQAYHSTGGIPFPPPPASAANVSTGYTVPVLKFFNPTANTPTSPTTPSPSANTPIPIPSSPVASVIPLPPPSIPQRPQSLIPGGFIAPRVVHPPSSSQPKEPSYTTLIPYFSPIASVSSLPTTSQSPHSIIPVNNSNNLAYTNDQYHDQQGKEEILRQILQQQQRTPPTVEYGPNSSPALSYLAISSQWTSSHGSTPAAPPPAPGTGSNPYSTFSPSPLSGAPTGPAPVGGNGFAAFTPSPLSSYSDSTEARNSLSFVPVVGGDIGGKDPQKTGDGLTPPTTPPRNPHGIL